MKSLPRALAVTILLTLPALAAETKVSLDKLPPAVREAIQKLAGKGTIQKTVQEPGDQGGTIYEVSYTQNGRKFEAEISPKGEVLVVDEEIALSEAPKKVQAAIQQHTAGGKVMKIERAKEGRETYYEAEFKKAGSGEHEVKVAPDGKVLKVE